jgi:mannosyltransferase
LPRAPWALVGLTALAAALRFSTLDLQSFWQDETVTVWLVQLDFGDLLSTLPDTESTPPVYYSLAWLWTNAFGSGEVGIRSLSALLGTATVPTAYLAGKELISPRVGLMTAALVATNPLLIWYSQEARSYALLVLLAALSFLFFTRALAHRESFLSWALVSILALATHYFAVFLIVPEALWLLVDSHRRRPALASVTAVFVAGAGLLPLALHQRAHGGAPELSTFSPLASRVKDIPREFLTGELGGAFDHSGEIGVFMLVIGLVVLELRGHRSEHQGFVVAGGVAGVAIGAPIALTVVGMDYVLTRNLLAGLIPFTIAVSACLGAGAARWLGLVVVTALCVLFGSSVVRTNLDPTKQRPNWRGAAQAAGIPRGTRLLVAPLVTPTHESNPIAVYRPRATPISRGWIAVSEIVVFTQTPRPRGSSLLDGFREISRRKAEPYTVISYAAGRVPAQVDVRVLGARFARFDRDPVHSALDISAQGDATVLVERSALNGSFFSAGSL